MQITKVSQATGVEHTREIQVNPDDYYYWEAHRTTMAGGYVQDAFPHLSADDREFLISGITPEEWEDLYGGWEEDEESDYTGYEDAEPRYDWDGFRF